MTIVDVFQPDPGMDEQKSLSIPTPSQVNQRADVKLMRCGLKFYLVSEQDGELIQFPAQQ